MTAVTIAVIVLLGVVVATAWFAYSHKSRRRKVSKRKTFTLLGSSAKTGPFFVGTQDGGRTYYNMLEDKNGEGIFDTLADPEVIRLLQGRGFLPLPAGSELREEELP